MLLAKRLSIVLCAVLLGGLVGCQRPADVASRNLSVAADNFEVNRRVVFFNGITDTYLLTIEVLCSLGNHDKSGELTVTCKVGPGAYKKHFLGLSDNVSFLVEQLESAPVNVYHYRVMFRPRQIVPDIELDVGGK